MSASKGRPRAKVSPAKQTQTQRKRAAARKGKAPRAAAAPPRDTAAEKRARETATAIEAHRAACALFPGVSRPLDDEGGTFYFDADEADRTCEFFPNYLRHAEGQFAGKPFELDPWQRELVIRPMFGWKSVATGLRRFRKVRIFVPKKNGKTTLIAGIALYMLFCDGEPAATIICAAADRAQAGIIFTAAKRMVEDHPDLAAMATAYARSIVYERSSIQVVSADVRTKHGPNIYVIIMDEFHAQQKRDLYETLAKGVAARLQPMDIIITTAGTDTESICYEEYEYAKKVTAGTVHDPTVLAVIFEAQIDDDWTDPAVWRRANPSLGKTVQLAYIEDEVRAAQNDPRKQNAFKNLHLNIWTQQAQVWIPLEWWDACRVPHEPGDAPVVPALGQAAYDVQVCGVDLSSKEDLTAFVVVRRVPNTSAPLVVDIGAPQEDDESGDRPEDDQALFAQRRSLNVDFDIEIHPFFWLPEETMVERAKRDRIDYPLWHKMGLLRVTPGPVVDYNRMFDDIVEEITPAMGLAIDHRGVHAPADIADHRGTVIAYDPWNASQFAGSLRDHGFFTLEVPQTVQRLSEPAKLFSALVKARRARHDGHRLMRWCVGNVAVKEDKKGNIFPFKTQRNKRIDGVAATIDALVRLMVAPKPRVKSARSGRAVVVRADGLYDAITGERVTGPA